MKYVFLAIAALVVTSTHAQVVTIDADDLSGQRSLTGETWRFQAGDSLTWAHPAYDDAHWDTTGALLHVSDSLYLADWEGTGWFRLKFQMADTTKRHVLLNATGYGVAELFLDGERMFSTGRIPDAGGAAGSGSALEDALTPREIDESVLFEMPSDSVHTLAIRYANNLPPPLIATMLRFTETRVAANGLLASGVRVGIAAPEKQIANIRSTIPTMLLFGGVTGIFAVVALLGALVYVLGVRDRALIYLTLALALLSLFLAWSQYWGVNRSFAWQIAVLVPLQPVVGASAFLCLGIGISLAFFPRRRMLRIAFIVVPFLVLLGVFIERLLPTTGVVILELLDLGLFGLIGGVILGALWFKKPGAWALGAGILLAMVIFVTSGLMDLKGALLLYFAYSLIPISIGGLIIARYTESARGLKARLVEVERLSEEKLAVEQDRQRLIESQKESLEEEVEARTQELRESMQRLNETQEQLIQSEKLASLGSLTAGIAHEIKNPLNFVNNFAEVGGELADELAEAIAAGNTEEATAVLAELKSNAAQITKHGRRADDIVKAMMQHARGGAAERETVDVNAFVAEYVDLAWHGMRAKDHTFDCEVERALVDDAGSAELQPQDMGRVLLNLLNNAFYATQMDGAAPKRVVRVETSRSADKKYVTIKVTDSGPGIPEDIREKIFEPFFTTKPTGEGTGLGLSLSYDIVAKGHGGSMTVGTNASGGALFTISLPVTP